MNVFEENSLGFGPSGLDLYHLQAGPRDTLSVRAGTPPLREVILALSHDCWPTEKLAMTKVAHNFWFEAAA